ncbi:hypothetical protein AAKU55_005644 [Oxalobacteraceae bacterium GrIS 1.11]
MKLVKNSWTKLKHVRDLLNESGDMSPKTGVWMSRLSRGAIVAQCALFLGCELAIALMWFMKGATDPMWALNAVVTCGAAIFFLSWLLAMAIDKHFERVPTTEQFMKWAGLTALCRFVWNLTPTAILGNAVRA